MVQILDVFTAFLLTDVEIVFKYIFNSSFAVVCWRILERGGGFCFDSDVSRKCFAQTANITHSAS